MHCDPRKILFVVGVSLGLVAFGCDKTRPDTKNPTDERAGAGADGDNSAPESLSNGGPDPDTTPLDQPSTQTPPPPGPGETTNPTP